jgi:hypothetical protein
MVNILDLTADRAHRSSDTVEELPRERAEAASESQDEAGAAASYDEDGLDALLSGSLGPDELSWDAHAPYSEAARSRRRLLTGGLFGAGILTAVLQASWSTGFAVIAGVAAWMLHERLTNPSNVHIGQRGITIDGHHTPHAQLTSFDIHQMRDGSFHLSLRTDARLSRHIHIPLGTQAPDEVHALLSRYVPEETHQLPFWEWWMRKA